MSPCLHFLLLLFLTSAPLAQTGVTIDVDPGATMCIGQELDQEDTATFKIKALPALSRKDTDRVLYASVHDPDEEELFKEPLTIGGSPQVFTTNIDTRGVYDVCLSLSGGHKSTKVEVDIEYTSRSGKGKSDPSKPVRKQDLPSLEEQLKTAEDIIADIGREIDFARRQEVLLKRAGEDTQSRIQWFSMLSIIILLVTGIWQLVYLRRFFTSKKLL